MSNTQSLICQWLLFFHPLSTKKKQVYIYYPISISDSLCWPIQTNVICFGGLVEKICKHCICCLLTACLPAATKPTKMIEIVTGMRFNITLCSQNRLFLRFSKPGIEQFSQLLILFCNDSLFNKEGTLFWCASAWRWCWSCLQVRNPWVTGLRAAPVSSLGPHL